MFRMRRRPILPGLEQYESEIKQSFEKIILSTKYVYIPDWTNKDLDRALKSLKTSQSQDTMGLVNKLFIMKNISENLKKSLLIMFNKMKNNCYVPDFLRNVFITAIPKKSKSLLELESERGIFLVPKLRVILSKLIYNSIIDTIEDNLSTSNIGNRRNKSPRDHLFVVYAVINETVQRQDAPCKDLVFTDVSQCFDSLWTEKTLLDLYLNGVQTNLLNLLYEISKSATIVVKTPVGNTEKGSIREVIMQGENLSGILCTSSMDRMSHEANTVKLQYRNKVEIPKMGFVDDILDMNNCGRDTTNMHGETIDQLNKQKLQVNKDKSVRIHVNGRKSPSKCEKLFVDTWDLEKLKTKTGFVSKDKYTGKTEVKTVDKYEYLGNIIESTGSNNETIAERVKKVIELLET